jgi:hypothetical protein
MSPKSKRGKFVEGRTPLSGEEFALRVGALAERQPFVLAARTALGRVCHVPESHIYPEDNPERLAELVWDWDDLGVILELERLLHISVGDPGEDFPRFLFGRFFWRKWPGPKSVGEWTMQVAEHIYARAKARTTS